MALIKMVRDLRPGDQLWEDGSTVTKSEPAVNFPGMFRVDYEDGSHEVLWPDEKLSVLHIPEPGTRNTAGCEPASGSGKAGSE